MKSDKRWEWQEVTDPKIIAETIWMADRPRTWREWISIFLRGLCS
jgi:hypothetical protein